LRLRERFAVRRDDKSLLQGRGASVHEARPNDGMLLELAGQSLQKSAPLLWMNRRCDLQGKAA
jgi:hypothetical protein